MSTYPKHEKFSLDNFTDDMVMKLPFNDDADLVRDDPDEKEY